MDKVDVNVFFRHALLTGMLPHELRNDARIAFEDAEKNEVGRSKYYIVWGDSLFLIMEEVELDA